MLEKHQLQLLNSSIMMLFSDAWMAIENIHMLNLYGVIEHPEAEIIQSESIILQCQTQIYIRLQTMFELLKLPSVLSELSAEYIALISEGKNEVEYDRLLKRPIFKPMDCLWSYYQTLRTMFGDERDDKRKYIERVLKGLPNWFYLKEIVPQCETDITHNLTSLFKLFFPSTTTNATIPHSFKCFRSDIQIKECGVLIECKFATTEKEVKCGISGVFEDIKGYSGSLDWTFFYSYIYQTEQFTTQALLDDEFSNIECWMPILVTGKGMRRKKPDKN